jgi:D-arabinose 1-dehydrogenase-like Zn-dependent alcohol dehydrogenase
MEIRAYAVPEKGAAPVPFSYRAEVGAHDVLVKLTHRSITRGDLQMIENDWGDARFPLVPSHEMVGIVDRTGSRVTELKPGDRVGVGYQLNACFDCTFCRRGTEQFCSRQTVVGVNAYGGLAEHIVVDARFAFPLPPQLASAPSTPLMSSGLTVFAAITYAQLPGDARVAVLGIGGLGRLALRFLQAMGHRVSAFSRSPEKRRTIEELGAAYVDGADPASLGAYRNTFDLILSTLNVPFDLNAYLGMLRPDGQLCLVATPLQPLSLCAGLLYDYARRRIYGNYVGSRADMARMLDFAAAHGVAADVMVMPFSSVNEAIERVRSREVATALVLESLNCAANGAAGAAAPTGSASE